MDFGGGDEAENHKEADEEQPQGLANYTEWNYDDANYGYYGGEWDGYWCAPIMKKEEDKEPMFKVVESPKSKKERIKNEKQQEEKRKKAQPPAGAWKMNAAKEQALMRRIEEKEECQSKEKAIMAVVTSGVCEYNRVEGMKDSGALTQ